MDSVDREFCPVACCYCGHRKVPATVHSCLVSPHLCLCSPEATSLNSLCSVLKTRREDGVLAPLINFGARWRLVVNSTLQQIISGMEPHYPCKGPWIGLRENMDVLKKTKNHFTHLGIRNLDRSARSPLNIQTALSGSWHLRVIY
jgi:hypothetical protein